MEDVNAPSGWNNRYVATVNLNLMYDPAITPLNVFKLRQMMGPLADAMMINYPAELWVDREAALSLQPKQEITFSGTIRKLVYTELFGEGDITLLVIDDVVIDDAGDDAVDAPREN